MPNNPTANFARDRALIIKTGIAAAGSSRADATVLSALWNKIETVPAGGGVKLPPAKAGLDILVVRADHSNTNDLTIYTNIASESVGFGNAAAVLEGDYEDSSAHFVCMSDGVWDIVGSHGSLRFPFSMTLGGVGALSVETCQKWADSGLLAGQGSISLGPVTIRSSTIRLDGRGSLAAVATGGLP